MRLRLTSVVEVPDEEIGTKYDALHLAIQEMERRMSEADGNDDLAEVIDMEILEE